MKYIVVIAVVMMVFVTYVLVAVGYENSRLRAVCEESGGVFIVGRGIAPTCFKKDAVIELPRDGMK